nr:MAG TPA: hypothetical protein [Bacteriophage sp.]
MCIDLLGQDHERSSDQDMWKPLLNLKNSIKESLLMNE